MRYLVLALSLVATPALASDPAATPTAPTPPSVSQPSAPTITPPHIARRADTPPMMMNSATGMTPPATGMMDAMTSTGNFMRRQFSPLMGDFSEYSEGKIAFLHTELHITPAQENAFTTFVDVLKSYNTGMNAHRETLREQRREMAGDNQLNLPTRLGLHIGGMEQDVQALKILQKALAEFYATLSDDQKKTADQLLGYLAR